ncbi:hypothetical protein ALC57_11515, partial [Trachymyrmex cornetzi]
LNFLFLYLGIFVNISEYSYFDPEYLYMLNQTKTEYGEVINSTELTSTVICQPLADKELRCYLNDMMVITSNYTNFNDRITTSNLVVVGHWFHMKFNDRGVMSMDTELGAGEIVDKYLIIYDVINQFNMGIDRPVQDLHWGSTATESTPIGFCTTTYKMNMRYWKKDAKQETGSNFQIKLLKNFSNQTDTVLQDLHIVKNRKDCNYSRTFNDYLNGGKVVCTHTYFSLHTLYFYRSCIVFTRYCKLIPAR